MCRWDFRRKCSAITEEGLQSAVLVPEFGSLRIAEGLQQHVLMIADDGRYVRRAAAEKLKHFARIRAAIDIVAQQDETDGLRILAREIPAMLDQAQKLVEVTMDVANRK